jgi:hypothetical protein
MFWSYIRGNLDEAAFEAWVYAIPGLETVLGAEDFLAVAGCVAALYGRANAKLKAGDAAGGNADLAAARALDAKLAR